MPYRMHPVTRNSSLPGDVDPGSKLLDSNINDRLSSPESRWDCRSDPGCTRCALQAQGSLSLMLYRGEDQSALPYGHRIIPSRVSWRGLEKTHYRSRYSTITITSWESLWPLEEYCFINSVSLGVSEYRATELHTLEF
jgi:hypothetical protein